MIVAWLLLVRPQRRRQAQQAEMLAGLAAGDEVVTAGGLYGTVEEVEDDSVRLEIAPGLVVRVAKRAIAAVLAPEDDEEADEVEAVEHGEPADAVDVPAETAAAGLAETPARGQEEASARP